MEETKELGIKSSVAKPNSQVTNNSSKSREEGELSSSDDDVLPTGSASQFTSGITAKSESILVPPVNKNVKGVKAGMFTSPNTPAILAAAPSRTCAKPNSHKSFEKSRSPFVPFLISFSDDDSGSETEEPRKGKSLETRGNLLGGDQDPALRRTARHETKLMPRKMSLGRSCVSSMTNINGASSRNGGPLLPAQRFQVGNLNTINKKITGREHGGDKNVQANTCKLQDLRQQIALRETELKLKSTQQSKETVLGSRKDHTVMNLDNGIAIKYRGTSADFVQTELKEPDKKRLKVSESRSSELISGGRHEMPVVQSTLVPENTVLEHCVQLTTNDRSCSDKEIQLGKMHSSISQRKKQHGDQESVSLRILPSGVKDGIEAISNGSQSGRNTKLADPLVLTEQTKRGANRDLENIPNKSSKEFKHISQSNCHRSPSSIVNKATSGQNLMRSNEFHEFRSGERAHKFMSDDTQKGCALHVPDRNFERSNASLNNGNHWNCLGNIDSLGNSHMNVETLLDIEELQDKELEEAQEHRRKCEVDERNALKAYRKAQRALIEANARCSYLYGKRELYSAHCRSLMVEGSSLFGSPRLHCHTGAGLNTSNDLSDLNMHLVPTSSNQMRDECDVFNPQGSGSNIQSADGALQNGSYKYVNGQNLASDPCSEPDASTSEPHKDKDITNGICSPFSNIDTSADEAEYIFPPDHQSNLDGWRDEEILSERERRTNDDSKRKCPSNGSQDSLLLEASLRSQLFAKLGVRTLSKKRGSSQSRESAIETGIENDDVGEKMDMCSGNLPFSEDKKGIHYDLGELPVQINNSSHVEKSSFNFASLSAADPMDSCFSTEGLQSTKLISFSCPILRSPFGHMKFVDPIKVNGLQDINQEIYAYDEIQPIMLSSESMVETKNDKCHGEVGPYTCSLEIDPVWPLCMYELRGKCNNDECSWQHVKDYSGRNMNSAVSNCTDTQVVIPSIARNHGAKNLTKSLDSLVLAPPTYLVSLDILKAESHSYESVPARSIKQCWRKCFSASLVVSSFLPTYLPSDEPFLHGTDARIEAQGSWNRQSLYFHSRNGKVSQLDQSKADTDQSLEMSLLYLSQEASKQKGRIEALKVLARALEADPTSVVLWIVYLHVYYSNEKSIVKDDMFRSAIEQNAGSYELWLMYINSRIQLNDRFVAYDTALAKLCCQTVHDSQCILDLFLQMMNCFCISGNFSNAIEKINGLFLTTKTSDNHDFLLLSDILSCLTIVDKCIFWICCVYLVVYKKLPDTVVQRFECEKDLSSIEWPSSHLTADEKQRAVSLMELAVDSLALYIDSESLESENTLEGAHLFALNHVQCIAVLEGSKCSRNLLDKYSKLYPSCLELVLMSARAHVNDCEDSSFSGFEEALHNWPEEVPGVQCIWNQYAECALQRGRTDFAQKLMDRWFYSVWKSQNSENRLLDATDPDNSSSAVDLDAWSPNSSPIDILFRLLNFSLLKLLQNDCTKARLAIDKAVKLAAPEHYKHCVREHAMFLLTDGTQYKEASTLLTILKGYLIDGRSFAASEPLSRSFIRNVKKPRVRQLVSNLWGPLSTDFSLVNSVLEAWYGQSLLPQKFSKLKDIVNLVEAILEIVPANYPLAISVCKLLSRGSESAELTAELTSPSVSFWASSLLVNALFQAVPVAPEYSWVEVAGILLDLTDICSISESFHKRALSVYPFSLKLWESYLKLSKTPGNEGAVIELAKERGITL